MLFEDKSGGFGAEPRDKAPPGLCSAMVQFDPPDLPADETPAADPRGRGAGGRRSRRLVAPGFAPTNPLLEQAFPALGASAENSRPSAPDASCEAAFLAGASLALLDQILRLDPPFAGALRQRLALRAATACAALARHREDTSALRDAEHLSPNAGGNAPPAPPGAFIACGAVSPRLRSGLTNQASARPPICSNCRETSISKRWPGGCGVSLKTKKIRWRRRRARGSTTTRTLDGAPRAETEILALWLSDLMLARKLGWDAPIALLGTTIAQPSLLRRAGGKRPRPGDPDWAEAMAGAYAMAASEAFALAGELSRRSQALLAAQSKLRAKGAGRVVELLLSDDAISPARAAKLARLSDRAARRLFDRLIELGAVRELSGRPNFRLYGL